MNVLVIDCGHGMSNRTPNVFDPGAVYAGVHEADVVLEYGLQLRQAAQAKGWTTYMTRASNSEHCPLQSRALLAKKVNADLLISLHCNAAGDPQANGTETLWRHVDSFAQQVHPAVVRALALNDRGVKQRTDLSVLSYHKSLLIELGFLSNDGDRAVMTGAGMPTRVAAAIAGAL